MSYAICKEHEIPIGATPFLYIMYGLTWLHFRLSIIKDEAASLFVVEEAVG